MSPIVSSFPPSPPPSGSAAPATTATASRRVSSTSRRTRLASVTSHWSVRALLSRRTSAMASAGNSCSTTARYSISNPILSPVADDPAFSTAYSPPVPRDIRVSRRKSTVPSDYCSPAPWQTLTPSPTATPVMSGHPSRAPSFRVSSTHSSSSSSTSTSTTTTTTNPVSDAGSAASQPLPHRPVSLHSHSSSRDTLHGDSGSPQQDPAPPAAMAPSTLERQPSPPRLASRRKSMSVPHAPDSQQGPRPKDQQHHPHYSLDIAPGADKMHQLSTVTVDRIRREEEEQRIAASGKKSLGLLKPQPSPHRHNQHAQTQAPPQPSPQAGRGGRHRSIHHFFFPIKRFLHKQHGPVPKPSVLKTSAPPSRSGSPPEPSSPRGGGGGDRLSTGSSEASAARRRYLSHEGSLKQYGKTVKVIGHGTGGTVRLLEEHSGKGSTNLVKKNSLLRSAGLAKASPAAAAGGGAPVDLTAVGGAAAAPGAKVYAVKEFRAREPRESEREYYKKITSEYCIGSSIHHDNIVETLDIVFEGSHIYEIMEYCPYDLFNVVASGKMGLDECACCWAQIVHGVRYLHSLGIAHRDLKLENCLLNDEGVLKIIDFGCAVVFKTPYEQVSHLVTGYTGSDPYIAPELHLQRPYDPKSSDLWSLGIILFAMTMAKFPWKAARRDVVDYATYSNNHNRRTAKPISTLPIEAARPLLASLLQPDVKKRATMDDILQDEWFKSIPYCKPGSPCKSHSHHLC